MLGLFVSIVGVAPSGAIKRNFYLPLTAMYANWCNTLAAPVPTMYNCTWIAYGPGKGTFFLGASLKGVRSPHSITGPWNEVIQEGRFALINDAAMIESGNTMKNCPEQRENDTFIRFGNCAETYPFVHLFHGNPAAVHGIALQRQGVLPANYEDSLSGSVWQNVRPLCANCRELTQMRRGCVANFDPLADASGAPP
ncbi:hypothetical protein PROQFM164_S11g000056 [Penicillium roqueforti FM164]|uniref:Uncharacterized protein n=1 Tax=Penicillium roqueforti (strain FM164) TaxID=1365484 RepID=W6QN93_PENRF|nr:hypothetical protein PROQFM164_S11g000056 [Penicillium roqueforti FM164]